MIANKSLLYKKKSRGCVLHRGFSFISPSTFYPKISFLLSVLVMGREICYNKSRTTVYFDFFERDDESSSFHPWLSYSLRKPYKSFSRRASTSGLLHGLASLSRNARRSDTRLRKSLPCSATSARFAIQIGVVLPINRERSAI